MSKSAGTLVTTHNATYIPPRFMPGYRGHVPTMKFDYGETYEGHTYKYFQDFRSKALETSKSNYCKGGYLPTIYSYNPQVAHAGRKADRARWLRAPRYALTDIDYDRKEDIIHFEKRGMAHRDHYSDKSGELHRVGHFVLPTKAENMFKQYLPFSILATRYTDDINIPGGAHVALRSPLMPGFLPRSIKRERGMRDVYFELR
ncbi:hypothetical protein LSAT2_001049 [Lamellibrachia satsuma]|nr:hypothetical protein LSAT2_001049 [Lamellibrachia satsuma]